ncbi:energy transducer TonB [Leisingera aquaemixtae]|uniref:energy transducer TonB n=1 Tax=Leisingera aquaemixtae TaxID=1396826 RepID=UPI001C97489F|nr:energy transducer TonB [Leisingera aquaemixtae]MBY6069219.1 energy transducer TonB [Leisingera aquaemixtae]
MQTGTKISLAGHGLLMGWVVFGAWFPSEPLPSNVQQVALISAEQFEKLSQQRQAPQVAPEPAPLNEPAAVQPAPDPEPQADPEPEIARPEPVAPAAPDPQVTDRPEPQPEPDVPVELPSAAEEPEVASLVPQLRPETAPRPVDRVAPEPVAPPEPDTKIDDIVQPEVAPEEGAETEQDVQEATAREAANDRIVTEENEGEDVAASAAPAVSKRPKTRPARPKPEPEPQVTEAAQSAEPEQPAKTQQSDTSSAVADALAEALAGGADVVAPEPSGPPLTLGEKDALRVEVSRCWNVGSLSTDALKTTVVVSVSLAQDGKPDTGSIRMLSSTGGSSSAAKQAYEAARRAIIRCGVRGFQLPPEKYAQWRDIEMTFNPERMRIK